MSKNDAHGNEEENKFTIQIGLVQESFAVDDVEIGVWPNDEELDYVYERKVILVRDAYLSRVERLVGGEVREGLIDGVTVWSIPRNELEPRDQEGRQVQPTEVTDALNLIDEQLGVGVASPNHVLSICPGGMCPAGEPEPVPAGTDPEPGICRGCDGEGAFIWFVDTGLLNDAGSHPWLRGVTGDPDTFSAPYIPPYAGHGTFDAGVARCMAPRSQVHVARVLHHAGAQLESEIIRHLDLALSHSPDIINLSAGCWSRKDLPPLGFEALWQRYRHHKGVQLVAPAGNNTSNKHFWPAAFQQVVAVGAISADWCSRASFSDYGNWVDVYAPGEWITNAYATGIYRYQEPPKRGERRAFRGMARWQGTCMAAAEVAGSIAACMSRTGENSRRAAARMLALARAQAIPRVGPVLYPCDSSDDHDEVCCRHGCTGPRDSHQNRCCHCGHHRD